MEHIHKETSRKFGDEAAKKAIGQFLFLRFISPPISVPHIYGLVAGRSVDSLQFRFLSLSLSLSFFTVPLIKLTPLCFSVLQDPPSSESQRILILITRMIQHLANETLPSTKQQNLVKLDEFVSNNISALHLFYDRILVSDEHSSCDGTSSMISFFTFLMVIGCFLVLFVCSHPCDELIAFHVKSSSVSESHSKVIVPMVAYENSIGWIHNFVLQNRDRIVASQLQVNFDFDLLQSPFPPKN